MSQPGRVTQRFTAIVGTLTIVASAMAASTAAAPAASAAVASSVGVSRPGTQVPVVVGPAPATPTLVTTTPVPPSRGLQAQSVSAAFVVNYDAGFNANPAAKAAFQFAVDQWSNLVHSSVPIVVNASFTALGPGILGSAGPTWIFSGFSGAPQAATWYPVALANARHGSDLAPTSADIVAGFSSSFSGFYFGTDGITGGKIDFVSVVLHELGHGLGFLGAMDVNGSGIGSYGGTVLTYDRFTTSNGTSLLSFADGSVALGNALKGTTVRFTGVQATAANGGTGPRLFAPNPWQSGSSYSHLDEATYPAGNANSLMTPAIGADEVIHSPGVVTLGIFADTGWVVSGLPVISIGRSVIVEGNSGTRYARFNVSLSDPVAYPVAVHYATINGTATSPADYTARSGTVTIPAGATGSTVAIGINGDTLVEGTQRFSVKLSVPAGGVIGTGIASGVITDDEPNSGVNISVSDAAIVEGNSGTSHAMLTVTLSRSNLAPVTVHWTTGAGTATAGVDYTATSGDLTFPAHTLSRTVSITLHPDAISEAAETLHVALSSPHAATIHRPVGTLTITDDD